MNSNMQHRQVNEDIKVASNYIYQRELHVLYCLQKEETN